MLTVLPPCITSLDVMKLCDLLSKWRGVLTGLAEVSLSPLFGPFIARTSMRGALTGAKGRK